MNAAPYIWNAIIESADLDIGECGFLDCWLSLDYGGSRQGFGGYSLYLPKSWKHHQLESVAGHHIFRILQIADVAKWSQLVGKTIRVRKTDEWGLIEAIGHITKDDWFCPKEDFASLRAKATGAPTT